MDYKVFIEFLNKIEKLKCNTRHSWTSSGRRESVAEHSWRLAVMAMLCADEYPDLDINKLIKMCLIHDIGEAVTGDVPSFWKNEEHEKDEAKAIEELLSTLPKDTKDEFARLFAEMNDLATDEAKLFKALDNMEAVLSHNEADISTWIPMEYEENLVYGQNNCEWSDWTRGLREQLKKDSIEKLKHPSQSPKGDSSPVGRALDSGLYCEKMI
ncbi:MAG: HD domain-containing protein [Ruminococcaceae bacterium]|nr:HD domain-containing protein [Oscillospiraceae bacterium]